LGQVIKCLLDSGCASILGDPGATSGDEAIFSGESLLQELRSPWELTEPVPEVVEFRPADWPEKTFFWPSARRSRRVTLSPSIDPLALIGPYNWMTLVESFRKKDSTKSRKSQAVTLELGSNTLPSHFSADL